MRLSIVISMHNKAHYADDFLRINRSNARDSELVLIDDGSSDNTGRIMQKYADHFACTDNVWEVKANNVGLRLAEGDYVGIVQDDDLILARDWMTACASFMEMHNIDVLGGRGTGITFFPPDKGRAESARLNGLLVYEVDDDALAVHGLDMIRRRREFNRILSLLSYRRQRVYPTDIVVRSPLIISRRALVTIGYLDERYAPLSYDDHAYCMSAKRASLRVAVTRIPQIGRYGNGSSWLYTDDKSKKEFFLRCEARNSNLFILENRDLFAARTSPEPCRALGTIAFRIGPENVAILLRHAVGSVLQKLGTCG